jgi:ABC-type transporter Mla subunit MlaD
MGLQAPRPAAVATALIFALSVFGFTLFVWKSFGGSVPLETKGYRFHVLFGADASNLTTGAEARISGVEVGRITKAEPVGDRIDAEIELQPRFAPIPGDTRAIVRSKTLLGETFVELTPGSRGAPKLAENASLPIAQVERAQGLDEVLGAFDAPTRRALKRFLGDLSDSLEDRGRDLNAALGNAAPTLEELERLVTILDHQRPALTRLVRDGGTALQAVGRRERAVQGLVTAGDELLGATARSRRELTGTVDALPAFLAGLRATLAEADRAAGDAGPTLRALRPVAPLVRPALDEAGGLVRNVVPLARELDRAIGAGRTGLPAATRIVGAAGPLVDVLHPAGRELVPVLKLLEAYRGDIVSGLANAASATQATLPAQPGGRPGQHYLRVLPPLNSEAAPGFSRRLGSNRHNAYPAPGGLRELLAGTPKAFDCANAANAQTYPVLGSGAPPCRAQSPWTFRGQTRLFPHVERDAP